MSVSDEQLNEWERLAESATVGPWFFAYSSVASKPKLQPEEDYWDKRSDDDHSYERYKPCGACDGKSCQYAQQAIEMASTVATVTPSYGDTAIGKRVSDGDFIAAAREAVPALVAEVRASRAREAGLRKDRAETRRNRDTWKQRCREASARNQALQQRIDKALD